MKNKRIIYSALVLGVLLLCVVAGWAVKGNFQSQPTPQEIPLVRTATVKLTGAGEELSYSGKVRGRYESQLAFQVNGKIIKRDVELGSTVKTGQILMQLDPIDIQQGVNSAKAQLASAESQFQLAKDNLDRFQKLYTDRLLSKAEFDNYRNAYEMATAGLNQARAQYTDASNKYNYCFLSANASGVIAAVNAEVGQVIGAGQPVVTLIRDGEKELEIQVPENRLEEIRDAKRLEVTFWALSNVKITGKIREVAPMADPASGTYRMRISLMNPPAELKLGMTATVRMADDEQTKMLYIPLSAIIQTGDSPGVWVVNEGLIRLRQVTLGSFGDDRVQVTEGLNAGERVVIAGVHKLQAGQKVRLGDDAQ